MYVSMKACFMRRSELPLFYHCLLEEMQSVYRKYHSTETELLNTSDENQRMHDKHQNVLVLVLD